MAETARELGLKVNGRRDERTNYYKSTRAAALYLRDLHNEFKDWLLVLAAYNAGPVPVYRAIHRSHSRNFWALERYLPAESRQHVKRFIATAWYFDQPILNGVEPMPNAVDLAGDGMGAAGKGSVQAENGAGSVAVVGCSEPVGAGFAVYSDIVKTDIREISILGADEHYQYDNRGPGNTAGTVQSGYSIPAIEKNEQCLAWNEPAAH
jgi:hypothetical protein